jgi:hypothetical protein
MGSEVWFAANRAVRNYGGPVRRPDGSPHPSWTALLRAAEDARQAYEPVVATPVRRCPACGRLNRS